MTIRCIQRPTSPAAAAARVAGQTIRTVLMACLFSGVAWAQVGSSAPAETKDDISQEAVGPIQYVGPDTYLLLDREGRPQPVLGMKYEDFLEAWKQSQRLGGARNDRRYSIEEVRIQGSAGDRYANLQVDLSIRLLSDEPVRVPLGMAGAILESQPQLHQAAEQAKTNTETGAAGSTTASLTYLDYDAERGGFVAGLTGRPGDVRRLSLELLVPLERDGDASTVRLRCPRALASRLTLSVDSEVADVSVAGGTLISQETQTAGQTLLTLAGLEGELQLSWRAAAARRAELATVLSANGELLVSIDGRSVRTDARLSVQSYGGSFDRFRVRLPPGAKLIEHEPAVGREADTLRPEYQLTLEQDPPSTAALPGDGAARQTVLVELPSRQQGPIEISLATEQPLGLDDADREVELAGFEVVGAVRQYGDVGLIVADDWQVEWKESRFVRQVDRAMVVPFLGQQLLTSAFQYDRQPWRLRARIDARPSTVRVSPEYQLELLPGEARLRVHLVYSTPGARAYEFRIAMRGWELAADPIESGGVVDRDRTVLTRDGVLILPLLQASPRRTDITFSARRPIAGAAERIELPLPVPVADATDPAELTVLAAPGIELLPDTADSLGLVALPVTDEDPSEADREGRKAFRFRSHLPEFTFTAGQRIRAREVSGQVAARVDLTASSCRVEQDIDYQVRHQPIKQLQFELPREWSLGDDTVEVTLLEDAAAESESGSAPETELTFALAPVPGDDAAMSSSRQAVVLLPQPRMDRFRVRLRYTVSLPEQAAGRGIVLVPFVLPVDAPPSSQRAVVRAAHGQAVSAVTATGSATWQQIAPALGQIADGELHFSADAPQLELPLAIGRVDPMAPRAADVQRVWLQTWLADGVRQDRAGFRFTSPGTIVAVELPPDVSPREVEVLLDGRLADVPLRNQGRLVVRVGAAPADADAADLPHTLELRYRQPQTAGWWAKRRLTPPQMIGTTTWSEVYWQIVLPSDVHVVRSPSAMSAAGAWQWLGNFWGRRPPLAQADLEQWIGATTLLAPSAAQNEYLYSGLAPVASIEVVTMPRWLIVLLASGAVVALALAWNQLPLVHRRWLLAGLAIVVAGLAVAFPEPAVLLGQASALGLAAVLVTALVRRLVARSQPWPQLSTLGGSSRHGALSRSDSYVLPPAPVSSSPTVQVRLSDSQR